MRIVITKNGKIIISEINPEVKYKNMITYSTDKHRINRKMSKQSSPKKGLNRSNSFGQNSTNNFNTSNNHNTIDVDDLLNTMRDNEKNPNSPKIVNLNLNQKINMPQSIAEKYMTKDRYQKDESENKNLLPDVFVSINKAIEKEASQKGYNYVYNSINSLSKQKYNTTTDNYSRRTYTPQNKNINICNYSTSNTKSLNKLNNIYDKCKNSPFNLYQVHISLSASTREKTDRPRTSSTKINILDKGKVSQSTKNILRNKVDFINFNQKIEKNDKNYYIRKFHYYKILKN